MSEDPLSLRPVEIRKTEDREIRIVWADEHVSTFPMRYLRGRCPCAACVDEWSGERKLDPRTVPRDVESTRISPASSHAVRIDWSDGHRTSIYAFRTLRAICPCRACQMEKP